MAWLQQVATKLHDQQTENDEDDQQCAPRRRGEHLASHEGAPALREADAKASEIYAKAYNQSPEARDFYEFTRTMQAYKDIISTNSTLVLSTESDIFKYLKGMAPEK